MSKQPAIAEIFEYYPEGINLTGFPQVHILDTLGRKLGQEELLKWHQTEVRGRKFVYPSFCPELAEKRQAFFKRLRSSNKVKKTFFDRGLPETRDLHRLTYEGFIDLCSEIYETLETARVELKPFRYMLEAKRILRRVNGFDSKLEKMLRTLEKIENARTFALDTEKGRIAFIPKMPENSTEFVNENSRPLEWNDETFCDVRLSMKKKVIDIAKDLGLEFRKTILKYVRDEFKFSPGKENLRRDYEQLAFPIRLNSVYDYFLEACREYDAELVRENLTRYSEDEIDTNVFIEMFDRFSERGAPLMHEPVYVEFNNHYDIRGLFPPTLMERGSCDRPFIPIDFKTKPSERKFLMAGLHSGGKSFFLENLVLLSLIGQMGEALPAESLTLPRYNRIFFYKNTSVNQGGKCESELNQINSIIHRSRERDLLVLDEFLDSADTEIAGAIGPAILDKLIETDATVMVTSHRCTDYKLLARRGWTLMTPDYEIREGKVIPMKRLVRGPPDHDVNMSYILERYNSIFNAS